MRYEHRMLVLFYFFFIAKYQLSIVFVVCDQIPQTNTKTYTCHFHYRKLDLVKLEKKKHIWHKSEHLMPSQVEWWNWYYQQILPMQLDLLEILWSKRQDQWPIIVHQYPKESQLLRKLNEYFHQGRVWWLHLHVLINFCSLYAGFLNASWKNQILFTAQRNGRNAKPTWNWKKIIIKNSEN